MNISALKENEAAGAALKAENMEKTAEIINIYTRKLENADNDMKSFIENELVDIGPAAVPAIVDSLQTSEGRTRGVLAMVLIRIGGASIDYLKRAARLNRDFEWIADYLITEIQGSAA